ncbi:MAG: rRNA maturation RNase YbeY [Defluviitaleaceae bacterium]|nr:rRNA maturation RNase YbeY [Defluviitaleaceae bacterium]
MRIYWNDSPEALTLAHQVTIGHIEQIGVALCAGVRVVVDDAKNTPDAFDLSVDDCEVSVSFVTPEEIRAMNRDYRGKNAETDVLSFPGFPGSPALGDIVICVAIAKRQAEEYGHTFERELTFLAVHGLLHLLGYDHETSQDEALMRAKQAKTMEEIGIAR